jgi:potassium-dependent mechanosensitive channel
MRSHRSSSGPSASAHRRRCKSPQLYCLLLILVEICLVSIPLRSQSPPKLFSLQPSPTPTASPLASASPVAIAAISLPQIADKAEELDQQLREKSKGLESAPELRLADSQAKADAEKIAERAAQADELLNGIPNMMQLQNEERYWRALAEEYEAQRKLLTSRAARVEEKIRWLETEQARWKATLDDVQERNGLEVVEQRVQQALSSIQQLDVQLREQLNLILTLQNTISEQDREIWAVVGKIDETLEQLRGRLFQRDGYPLWAIRELRAVDQPASGLFALSAHGGFGGGDFNFLRANKALFAGATILYMFSLGIAIRLRKQVESERKREVTIPGSEVFARPFSVALLVTFLATIGINASAPAAVSFIVCLLYLIPVVRLLPLLIGAALRKSLYLLCVFYLLEWVHLILQFRVAFKREFFFATIALAFGFFATLNRPSRLKIQPERAWQPRLSTGGIWLGLFLLAGSAIANVLGFVSLSQILGVGTLFSVFIFALLYTMVRVLDLSIVIVVNSVWFQSLAEGRGGDIERFGRRLLIVSAAILWLNVILYLFTVRGTVLSVLHDVLQYPIGSGKVFVTLGGTLSIVVLLVVGYVVANVASFVLGKILLPKLSLRGGMAYAISRVTYYFLLAGLFFMAVINAGLQLDKFTVITGALGLGIGFGLQNIVSNFASGLIVLFERPIRINDTVEIGGITGIVRRIGARSSTVLTAQGAEVIFPNSNLLSNQVTNWTLSSTRRRVEVAVGVSYGTDPKLVLDMLTEIAVKNPHVLAYPPPQTVFLGFGENALNFELTFWAAQSVWFELKSAVGLAVLQALRQAGIEIPYPQRDLHVRILQSLDKDESGAVSESAVSKKVVGL